MFQKLLIADRGEIVLRIERSCERLGVATVAVHDEHDAGTAYVAACDEALGLAPNAAGGFEPGDLIAAAKQCGADAVHPGTTGLARDSEFARAVVEAGLGYVGAASEVLAKCSGLPAMQELARLAGCRALAQIALDPGDRSADFEHVRALGFPLALLAGDGSEVTIEAEEDLADALERSVSGGGPIAIKRRLHRPRLLSVLVVGDSTRSLALGDAERSLQLAGRPWIDESPAPALTLPGGAEKRSQLRMAAASVVREAGFAGACALDFAFDTEGKLHLLGIRPELPEEHALFEACTGLDLVEIQLRVASGEPLPVEALRAQTTGHAMLARLFASEQPDAAAQLGSAIAALRWPTVAPGRLRVDSELAVGASPRLERNGLLAKLVAFGPTRHQALLTLDRVLAESVIEPPITDLERVRAILADEAFRAGQYDSSCAERVLAELRLPQ